MGAMQAINCCGVGPFSSIVRHMTMAGMPGPPGDLRVAAMTATSLTLAWDAAAEHGRSVTRYVLEYMPHGGNRWMLAMADLQVSCEVPGLTPGHVYVFRVRADNAVRLYPVPPQSGLLCWRVMCAVRIGIPLHLQLQSRRARKAGSVALKLSSACIACMPQMAQGTSCVAEWYGAMGSAAGRPGPRPASSASGKCDRDGLDANRRNHPLARAAEPRAKPAV